MPRNIIKGTKKILNKNKKAKRKRSKRPPRKRPFHDITGQKFGRLEVLRMERTSRSIGGEFMAICKCHACGRENYEAKPSWVKKGSHSGTCGCSREHFKRQTGKNSVHFKGYKEMSGTYLSAIKRRSNKLGLSFDLNIKFLWDLYENQNRKCALSGIKLFFCKKKSDAKSGNISLDRIDSKKGYVKSNVQWLHKNVNLMKMYLDQKVFLNYCRKVYLHNQNKVSLLFTY